MNGPSDSNTPRGLGEWWLTPPRPGLQRLINPWEYRHLRACGAMRLAGGVVAGAAGAICLGYGVYGWAALFGALAAANLAGGSWYISIARSGPARA